MGVPGQEAPEPRVDLHVMPETPETGGTLTPLFNLQLIDEPDEDTIPSPDADPSESTKAEVSKAAEGEADPPPSGDDADAELLSIMRGENKPADAPAMPEGVDPQVWEQFQAYQQQQAAAGEAPAQPAATQPAPSPAPEVPPITSIFETDEEYDNFFSDRQTAETVLGRVAQNVLQQGQFVRPDVMQQQMAQAMQNAYYSGLKSAEVMLHVHEMTKEHPELFEFPDAFDVALGRELSRNRDADPQEWVAKATQDYLRTYRVAKQVEATKQSGRKVDVRGAQTPPSGGKTLPRQENGKQKQPGNGALEPLFRLWGEQQ